MRTFIQVYETIKQKVKVFSKYLRFDKLINKIGRKLALTIEEIISLALFKQTNGIAAKKSLYKIFQPDCSYKTLVVNLNRFAPLALKIFLTCFRSIAAIPIRSNTLIQRTFRSVCLKTPMPIKS